MPTSFSSSAWETTEWRYIKTSSAEKLDRRSYKVLKKSNVMRLRGIQSATMESATVFQDVVPRSTVIPGESIIHNEGHKYNSSLRSVN